MQGNHKSAAKVLITVAAVIVLASGIACGPGVNASGEKAGASAGGGGGLPVKVQIAELKRVPDFTEYLATLQSRNAAVVMPQVEGHIVQIFVHSGDRVERGEPLLQIDPDKQRATVTNQEATLNAKLATLDYDRSELERQRKLFEAGVVSRQAYDQAQQAYNATKADAEATRASIQEQKVQLRYYSVRALQTGIVGDIPVRVGDRVTTTTPLTTVDRDGKLEAYVYIPADKASKVHQGTLVDIFTDGTEPVRTRVTFVSPRVNPNDQTLLIKTEVPNDGRRFRNDQVVRARVVWNEIDKPTIPVTAVTRLGGQAFAFVAAEANGKHMAKQQPIQLGGVLGNDYVVMDGLKPGDKIITSSVQILADGMPVTPQQ
jgi:RND family efflux transporter MFP subunit